MFQEIPEHFGLNWNKKAFSIAAEAVAVVSSPQRNMSGDKIPSTNSETAGPVSDGNGEGVVILTPNSKRKPFNTQSDVTMNMLMDRLRNILPIDISIDYLEEGSTLPYFDDSKTYVQPDLPLPFNSPLWKDDNYDFGGVSNPTNLFPLDEEPTNNEVNTISSAKKSNRSIDTAKHKVPVSSDVLDQSAVNDAKSVGASPKSSSLHKNDDDFKSGESKVSDDVLEDDDVWEKNSVASSVPIDHIQSVRDHFARGEENARYDGPPIYAESLVTSNLELYFRSFVFSNNLDEEESFLHENEEVAPCIKMPRIKISDFDLELATLELQEKIESLERVDSFPNYSVLSEKIMDVFRFDVIPCGRPATSCLAPNRRPLRGFHGDIVTTGIKDVNMTECRQIVLCMSDSAIYIVPDSKSSLPKSSLLPQLGKSKIRKYPSRIPHDATFNDAYWPHAIARHPMEFLERITIGFGFQRLILHFSIPDKANEKSESVYGGQGDCMSVVTTSSYEFSYIVLICNKLRTMSIIQKLQSYVKEINSTKLEKDRESITFDNDDKVVLDALGTAVAPASVGAILHYQILRQRWKHGERDAVRRVCVLTDTHIYLLNENYVGDGTTRAKKRGTPPGNVVLEVVDSGTLDLISEIKAADEDPRSITLVIKAPSRLKRAHRWRLLCYDGEGAERLIDDVRKATVMEH